MLVPFLILKLMKNWLHLNEIGRKHTVETKHFNILIDSISFWTICFQSLFSSLILYYYWTDFGSGLWIMDMELESGSMTTRETQQFHWIFLRTYSLIQTHFDNYTNISLSYILFEIEFDSKFRNYFKISPWKMEGCFFCARQFDVIE